MCWTRSETKRANLSVSELHVRMMLSEIEATEWVTSAEQFKDQFTEKISCIHIAGCYVQPVNSFRCKIVDPKKVEIWKVKSNGDELKKLYVIIQNNDKK